MSSKKTRKILKSIINRMNDLKILHYFYGMNIYQLLQNKDTIVDFICNYYMDLDLMLDKHICIDGHLNYLINKLDN